MSPRLSVVIPIHNEADFLPQAIPALVESVHGTGVDAEILIIENGSTDDSASLAARLGGSSVRVIQAPVPDYGEAMAIGFMEAKGDWIVNADIDYFSRDFFEAVIDSQADIVIGSKRDPASEDLRPLIRRVATRVFNLLLRVLLDSRVSDTHGLKGFRREVVESLVPVTVSRKDLFDTELVVRAERAGYDIAEVPVVVRELREARSSLVKRVPRTIKGLLRIRRILAR